MAPQPGLQVIGQQRRRERLFRVVGPGIGQHQGLRPKTHPADQALRQFTLGAQVQRLQHL
jgi:hypothetical protein